MPIVYYGQLSHVQRRHVHQLLHSHQLPYDVSFFQPLEECQWSYLESGQIQATLGYHVVHDVVRLTNGAFYDIQAFRRLAISLHTHALRQGCRQIHVQVSPPHDLSVTSIWKELGYSLYAEQFRLIGLSDGQPATLRLKAVHERNQDTYLALRNDALKGSTHFFPHSVADLEKLIRRKAVPYLVYDKQLIVGTLLFQKLGPNIRLLEITCLPGLRRQGYGSRILHTFQEKLRRSNIQTFEVFFLSTQQDVLRLYRPTMFCDIQLTSYWHTFSTDPPPLIV